MKKEEKVINDLVYFKDIKIVQNKNYFNFSLDSILLPNFVNLTEGTKNILDLCTGSRSYCSIDRKKCSKCKDYCYRHKQRSS